MEMETRYESDPPVATEHHDIIRKPKKSRWRSYFSPAVICILLIVIIVLAVLYVSSLITNMGQNIKSAPDAAGLAAGLTSGVMNSGTGDSNVMIGLRQDGLLQDCQSSGMKKTFPDIDYSFYGYNILKGYPLADGRDPGFTRPIFAFDFSNKQHTADCRFSLPRGLTAAPDVACRTSFTSTTVESSKELQSSLDVNAHVSGGGWGVSFSASAGYKKATSSVQSGKYKLIMSTASCKYYFAKLNELDLPELSPEVLEWINRMTKSIETTGVISDALVYDFVDYFGTHFPSEMVYGARFTYENKVTSSNYKSMSSKDISVSVQASYSGAFSVGGGFGLSDSQKESAQEFRDKSVTSTISIGAPPPYNGDAMTWASTVKDTPVPVQFDLIPIYELFDDRRLNLNMYFGKDTSRKIRDKILSITSKYCRILLGKGVQVQCNDDSVIKIEDYAMSLTGISGGDSLNATLDECIDECMRRKTCVMTTLYPQSHSYYVAGTQCRLDDHDETRREMRLCTNCKSFIDPNGLYSAMGLQNLRYDSSVSRQNKVNIKGQLNYDQLRQFCSVVCTTDPRCTGFEFSNQTYYEYNCATYSEHSTHFVSVKDHDFETYFMPDLAKRTFRENYLDNTEIHIRGLSVRSTVTSGLPVASCNEACSSNLNCIVSSPIQSIPDQCYNVMDEQIAGTMRLVKSEMSKLIIYSERSTSGWVNLTLPIAFADSLESSGLTKTVVSCTNSVDSCGKACAEDILCRIVYWESQGCCFKYSANSLTTHLSVEIPLSQTSEEPSKDVSFVLMIPNHRAKLSNLMAPN